MARYGRGLICLTLTRERCRQLRLPLMVSETDLDQRTNFTVSIEAAEGVTTGISAYDRAHTIRAAVRDDARAEDLRQPGHIFPLMAQPGGVLTPCRSHRSRLRPREARGFRAGRRSSSRYSTTTAAWRAVRTSRRFARRHGLANRHDRRPDPLPAREGTLRRAHRRARHRHRCRAVPALCATRITSTAPCISRSCAAHVDGSKPPLVRVHLEDTVRDLVGAREQRHELDVAQRDGAHRRGGDGRHRAAAAVRDRRSKSPRPCAAKIAAIRRRRAPAVRACCAPTASAPRSCATWVSRTCAC